jgi:hypothetical protein
MGNAFVRRFGWRARFKKRAGTSSLENTTANPISLCLIERLRSEKANTLTASGLTLTKTRICEP